MGIPTRSFPPGNFLVEIAGASAGYARNLQGGGVIADVITEKVGADHIVHKHVGGVRFEDIVLTCDAGLSKAFYDWVDQTFQSKSYVRRDGAVVVVEAGREISRLEWKSGLITWAEFPALDASSRDLVAMTIKISPEFTRTAKGSGSPPTTPARKGWLGSSFLLRIDGLEDACRHVSRVEPIAIGWGFKTHAVGQYRDVDLEPTGHAELGNLVVTLPESRAQGFQDWFEDFVIKGNSGQSREKHGTLESGSFSLEFGNLGVSAITRPSGQPGAMIRKTRVEMYCESVRFHATAG